MTDSISHSGQAQAKLNAMIALITDQASDFPICRYPVTEAEAQEEVQASADAFGLDLHKGSIVYLMDRLYERTAIGLIPAEGVVTGNDLWDAVTFVEIMESVRPFVR